MTFKNDRSSLKTRNAIKKSLMSLLLTADINNITIKQITDDADLNRNTFYTHYCDIYDVVDDIEQQYMSHIIREIDAIQLSQLLDHTQRIAESIKASMIKVPLVYKFVFTSTISQLFIDKIKKNLILTYCEKLNATIKSKTLISNNEYLVNFIVAGFLDVIRKWYCGGDNQDISNLIRLLTIFTLHGFNSAKALDKKQIK